MQNDVLKLRQRIGAVISRLQENLTVSKTAVQDLYYVKCDYKKDNVLPDVKSIGKPFQSDSYWGGERDSHFWFYTELNLDKEIDSGLTLLQVKTVWADRNEMLNAQFMVYVNGKFVQGFDSHHDSLIIREKGNYKIHIYAYSGPGLAQKLPLDLSVVVINKPIERLIRNLSVPDDVLSISVENTKEYYTVINSLNEAINILNWQDTNSKEFFDSVDRANEYMEEYFYKKVCGKGRDTDSVVACVGHTHIDIAWLWSVRQTVEKAQRSFANVVSLMKEYPEYIFMS
ncbi:MAG: hypothetical protein MJ072_03165, partial [Clostridia bacterium]|nr:hypothetical protein [Clostridia bacterium]